jgi:hypothetical protein
MKRVNKVKVKNHSWIGLIFIGNGVLAGISIIYNLLNLYLYLLVGIMFTIVLINLIFSFRTTNKFYLVTALHYSVCLGLFLSAIFQERTHSKPIYLVFFFTMFFLLIVGLSRKLKWRKREILEMAAHPVNDITNGFTNRPYPVGSAEYTPDELKRFATFILKKLIAIPYEEENRVIFVISSHYINHILNLKNDCLDETSVTFDFKGNISTHITKKDYVEFKEQLSFDQLCHSLGRLFIEFLDLYKKEEQERIIDRMNEYKFNPFFGGIIGF